MPPFRLNYQRCAVKTSGELGIVQPGTPVHLGALMLAARADEVVTVNNTGMVPNAASSMARPLSPPRDGGRGSLRHASATRGTSLTGGSSQSGNQSTGGLPAAGVLFRPRLCLVRFPIHQTEARSQPTGLHADGSILRTARPEDVGIVTARVGTAVSPTRAVRSAPGRHHQQFGGVPLHGIGHVQPV